MRDLKAGNIYGKLGQDINLWMKCFNDIKKSRTTFHKSETRKGFIGPIVVNYAEVQNKVSLKYDSWHKDTLPKFGALLCNEMNTFHAQVNKSRTELDQRSTEPASTSDAVTFITYVQQLKKQMKSWEKQVET